MTMLPNHVLRSLLEKVQILLGERGAADLAAYRRGEAKELIKTISELRQDVDKLSARLQELIDSLP